MVGPSPSGPRPPPQPPCPARPCAYEVELVKPDGSSAEVKLDANFKVLDIDRDGPNDRDDRDD